MTGPYYEDEFVRLFLGDCLEVTEWLSADVLVTDPPYGMNAELTRTALDVPIAGDHDTGVRDAALALWLPRPAIVFGHWRQERPKGVTHLAVWDKVHMALGAKTAPFATNHEEIYLLGKGKWVGGRRPTVIRAPNWIGESRPNHPAPKPQQLMETLVGVTPPGTIADPFAGSGSTLVAAKALGRKAIGVELEEKYCEIAARRLSQDVLDFGGAA